jgi:hypothetical protein
MNLPIRLTERHYRIMVVLAELGEATYPELLFETGQRTGFYGDVRRLLDLGAMEVVGTDRLKLSSCGLVELYLQYAVLRGLRSLSRMRKLWVKRVVLRQRRGKETSSGGSNRNGPQQTR